MTQESSNGSSENTDDDGPGDVTGFERFEWLTRNPIAVPKKDVDRAVKSAQRKSATTRAMLATSA